MTYEKLLVVNLTQYVNAAGGRIRATRHDAKMYGWGCAKIRRFGGRDLRP